MSIFDDLVASSNVKPGTDKILARAALAAERAGLHLRAGALDRAAERAYHAIVHAARALLNEAGLRSRTHQIVGERIDTLDPAAPAPLRAAVAAALRWRVTDVAPLADDVEDLVAHADAAVAAARDLVGRAPRHPGAGSPGR